MGDEVLNTKKKQPTLCCLEQPVCCTMRAFQGPNFPRSPTDGMSTDAACVSPTVLIQEEDSRGLFNYCLLDSSAASK